jgi:hypothetical protein
MLPDDRISSLLQTADAAVHSPQLKAGLSARVRQRDTSRRAASRRLNVGLASGVAVLLVSLVSYMSISTDRKGPGIEAVKGQFPLPASEIASLRAESESLNLQANALERWIANRQRETRLGELADEHDRLVIAQCEPDPVDAACDRAAGTVVSQGDFMWEVLGSRAAAEAAYRNAIEHFPDTRWAALAEQNLARMQMN